MTRHLTAAVLACLLLLAGCKYEAPSSPNGSCEETPGQCGYHSK